MKITLNEVSKNGLYSPEFEHDNCGIGAIVNIKGKAGHGIVADALSIVENLEHRAGKDAEGKTGDGVGILTQIPHKFFKKVLKQQNIDLPDKRGYGVGMIFFPQDELQMRQAKAMLEVIVKKNGLEIIAFRKVDTDPGVLGSKALECMPNIYQVFIRRPDDLLKTLEQNKKTSVNTDSLNSDNKANIKNSDLDFDRLLYIVRREFEQSNVNTYIPSLSCRTIVYKGMFLVGQLRTFFKDLMDKDYESAIAMVHSRFSTNTTPSWRSEERRVGKEC